MSTGKRTKSTAWWRVGSPSGAWRRVTSTRVAPRQGVAGLRRLVVRRGDRVREAHAAGHHHPLLLMLRHIHRQDT